MKSRSSGGAFLSAMMMGVVALMVIPLPGFILDMLISVNIAIGVMLLLATMLTSKALELSAFPSLLLMATLFRLALNVSSTRLILTTGEAGGVITAFGTFVVGGSVVVGLVVFMILVVIQFVVITNGASRVAEVGARFTLDAMPGKQMAIDADLGAGVIDEETARKRRSEITSEADFYGAMDGASKFVKGDAVAGVLITLINLIGGLVIGVVQMGMPFGDAVKNYSALTVGDGLVSQIPALLISIASGIIVTRASNDQDLGSDIGSQFRGQATAFFYAGIAIVALGLAPGLPKIPFFATGGALIALSRRFESDAETAALAAGGTTAAVEEETPNEDDPRQIAMDIRPEPLGLELAVDMVDLVDPTMGGDLLDRVRALRRKIAMEMGLIIPPVRTRDNIDLGSGDYLITMHGVELARGNAPPGHVLVIADQLDRLPGIETTEPVFGLPAKWIRSEQRALADAIDGTVVDRPSVIATHLAEIVRQHAAKLLSRQEVKDLVDLVRQSDPAVVDELAANDLTIAEVQRVLQDLLDERVPIRDIVRILDVLGERARLTRNQFDLSEAVRTALGSSISASSATPQGVLPVITLAPQLEQALLGSLREGPNGYEFVLAPDEIGRLVNNFRTQMHAAEQSGLMPVILTSKPLRRPLRRLLALTDLDPTVLAIDELGSHLRIETLGTVNHDNTAALHRA
ncbi:MAG: flagellar biosynthesis protein FlhA [Acidimicrobiales bacterium]